MQTQQPGRKQRKERVGRELGLGLCCLSLPFPKQSEESVAEEAPAEDSAHCSAMERVPFAPGAGFSPSSLSSPIQGAQGAPARSSPGSLSDYFLCFALRAHRALSFIQQLLVSSIRKTCGVLLCVHLSCPAYLADLVALLINSPTHRFRVLSSTEF